MFWTVAFWVLLPFLVLLCIMATVAAVVKKRRYHPTEDDYQDWSGKAARQREGDHFGPPHGGF